MSISSGSTLSKNVVSISPEEALRGINLAEFERRNREGGGGFRRQEDGRWE